MKGADGEVVRWLTARTIAELRERALVSGGMLPKLLACEQALRGGVGRVRILPAGEAGMLPKFYHSRINLGTEVVA